MTPSSLEPCDEHWMRQALIQAQEALRLGEVPVGAVVVRDNECVAVAHNTPITNADPSAHAEINALRLAGKKLNNYRLEDCTVYVTLEPCAMCAMAMLHARVKRVIYGATDLKTGAAGSVINLFENTQINHQTSLVGGVLASECSDLLTGFFSEKRLEQKEQKVTLRDDALRTPEEQFVLQNVPQGLYTSALPSLNGLRLHYHFLHECGLPEHPFFILLHDGQGYSEQYRTEVATALSGQTVLIPDLIGFGRSDKPKKESTHTVAFHAQVLCELVAALQGEKSKRLTLVAPQSLASLALALRQRMEEKGFVLHLCFIQQLPRLTEAVADLPYLDKGYLAGPRALQQWGAQTSSVVCHESHGGEVRCYQGVASWLRDFEALDETTGSSE